MNQYKVSCREMGVSCGYSADGRKPSEVKAKLYAHAQKDHLNELKDMSDLQWIEMDDKMNSLLRGQVAKA